jgi:hypothetical protein
MFAFTPFGESITMGPNTATHHWFLETIVGRSKDLRDGNSIQNAVEQITEAFYCVRFGNRHLDNLVLENLERTSIEFEQHLKIKPSVNDGNDSK